MSAEHLAIDVLGPLAVRRAGGPVTVGGPRPRALLVRLVVAGELVATDRLVEDLWAGDPPRSAVNTLQTYVSTLRRALGDLDQSIVVREGPGYRIALDDVDVDAERFATLTAAARTRIDPAERLRDLDEALGLWRGPALVDVADAAWARPVAEQLEEARLGAVEDRFDALLALGDHAAVTAELPAAIAEHPLRERLAGQLVLALYRSGRQAEALRAYDRTRDLLVTELGLEPGPDLAALQRAVLEQDPALDGPVAVGRTARQGLRDTGGGGPTSAGEDHRDGDPVARPRPSPPLPTAVARSERRTMVGREDALDELRRRWAEAATGRAPLVLVTGEPGIGKSRLAAAFAADVHAHGGTVLWGACTREPLGPYQPFAGALRDHLRSLSGRDASRMLEAFAPLAPLVPELSGSDQGGSTNPGVDRFQLFEATSDALSLLAAQGGLVLVVDDLHWADPDTCALLTHVLRHEAAPSPLVLATVRSHDADPNPALVEAIADLQRDRLVTRLPLDGLSVAAVGDLARSVTSRADRSAGATDDGADPPPVDASDLQRATGGNPYFVEELLAARHEGRHDVTRDDPHRLPESVRDVLRARLQRLGAPAREVLDVAALVGASFDLAIVDRAGEVHDDDLLDRLDRAVDAGLLVESTELLGRYTFAHELVRQALVEEHSGTRRARLHLRIADALTDIEATGGVIGTADLPAAVAHHRLEALPLGDVPTAVQAAVAAARDGVDRLAFDDARAAAELALAVIDRTGVAVPPADRAALLCELGRARRAAGDLAAAVEAYTDAVREARTADRADLEADAALGVVGPRPTGTRLDYAPPDPELLATVEHALEATGDDSARRAELLAARVWLLPRTGSVSERLAPVEEALAVARDTGDAALEARVLLARHATLLVPDRLDDRIETIRTAIDRAVAAGAGDIEMLARVAATTDLVERADIEAARAQVQQMSALADRLGQTAYRFYPATFGVFFALLDGDHRSAEAQAYAMYEATKELRTDVPGEIALVSRLYQVARDRGRMAELFPLLADQLVGNRQVFLNAAYALAAAEVGEEAAARAQLRLATGGEDDLRTDLAVRDGLWLATTAVAAETACMLGDARVGAALAPTLEPFAGRLVTVGTMYCLGSVDRYVGLSHLAAGDLDEADRWLASGIELDRRAGARTFVVRGLSDRSLALRRRGDPADGQLVADLAAEARDLADALGLGHPWSSRASIGADPDPTRPDDATAG